MSTAEIRLVLFYRVTLIIKDHSAIADPTRVSIHLLNLRTKRIPDSRFARFCRWFRHNDIAAAIWIGIGFLPPWVTRSMLFASKCMHHIRLFVQLPIGQLIFNSSCRICQTITITTTSFAHYGSFYCNRQFISFRCCLIKIGIGDQCWGKRSIIIHRGHLMSNGVSGFNNQQLVVIVFNGVCLAIDICRADSHIKAVFRRRPKHG